MLRIIPMLRNSLSPLYDERETNTIIEMLVEGVCGWTRNDYLMHRADTLPDDVRLRLMGYAVELAQGVPIQQVLGYAEFLGRRFRVTKDTLIPRPETAELVNWVINDADKVFHNPISSIVDIGTGTGCIAISLALRFKDIHITAIDLSTAALQVAAMNANELEASNVQFVRMDILKPEDDLNIHRDFHDDKARYPLPSHSYTRHDIIVSNPPYVRESEAKAMSRVVLDHEPHMALFVSDKDPLVFYRAIARFGKHHLNHRGVLYLEINEALGNEVRRLLSRMGYEDIIVRRDFYNRDRMVRAFLP